MSVTADRVQETSSTTGTGALTLGGAVSQYHSFAEGLGISAGGSVGDVMYAIIAQSGTDFEVGLGTFTYPNTLSRDRVTASSNTGALVNFTGNTNVFLTVTVEQLRNATLGIQLALRCAFA